MSLARLLVNQGRLGEACTMLAEIYAASPKASTRPT